MKQSLSKQAVVRRMCLVKHSVYNRKKCVISCCVFYTESITCHISLLFTDPLKSIISDKYFDSDTTPRSIATNYKLCRTVVNFFFAI